MSLYPEDGPVVRVETSSAYDAFGWGTTLTAGGTGDQYSPVGFGGQYGYYRDYTGLYLLTHRYYDAGAGRFVSRDPIGYKGGINLYGFAGNNPVNESDPSGFDPTAGNKLPEDEVVYQPARRGLAPLDKDGHPIELHHRNQNPEGPIDELDWQTHRGSGNHGRNHPNSDSDVDHGNEWKKWKRKYWEGEWDGGRFGKLPQYGQISPTVQAIAHLSNAQLVAISVVAAAAIYYGGRGTICVLPILAPALGRQILPRLAPRLLPHLRPLLQPSPFFH